MNRHFVTYLKIRSQGGVGVDCFCQFVVIRSEVIRKILSNFRNVLS